MRGGVVFARLLVFAFTFSLEVRVKAAEIVQIPNASKILEQPTGCLEDLSATCAIGTGDGEKFKMELGGSFIQLDQSTSVIRRSAKDLELVSGTIWVKAKGEMNVRSEFGSAIVSEGAEAWVMRQRERMTVAAMSEGVRIVPRGSSEAIGLLAGTENWLGRVGVDGVAMSGVPTAIALEPHLARWARLYVGNRKQFEKDALKFRETWIEAGRATADIHRELHDRKVASVLSEKAEREEALRKKLARDREIREMFRRKVLSGE